jgi:TPR repeat protein
LEFDKEDVLQRVERGISAQDCRGVFCSKEQMLLLEPGDTKTKWQLYAESAAPSHQEWRWLWQAADQGHALAHHRLGTIYYYGLDGVEKDLVLAYVWYSLAENTGPEVKQLV